MARKFSITAGSRAISDANRMRVFSALKAGTTRLYPAGVLNQRSAFGRTQHDRISFTDALTRPWPNGNRETCYGPYRSFILVDRVPDRPWDAHTPGAEIPHERRRQRRPRVPLDTRVSARFHRATKSTRDCGFDYRSEKITHIIYIYISINEREERGSPNSGRRFHAGRRERNRDAGDVPMTPL